MASKQDKELLNEFYKNIDVLKEKSASNTEARAYYRNLEIIAELLFFTRSTLNFCLGLLGCILGFCIGSFF